MSCVGAQSGAPSGGLQGPSLASPAEFQGFGVWNPICSHQLLGWKGQISRAGWGHSTCTSLCALGSRCIWLHPRGKKEGQWGGSLFSL